MALHPRELKLGEALVRLKVIDELQLASAIASADQWGQRLTESLLRLRLVRELSLVDAISSLTRTEKVDLAAIVPDPAALALLEADHCRRQGIFPFALAEQGRVLQLAMVDPSDVGLSDSVASRARVRVQRFVAGETTIQKAIQRHYLGLEQVGLEPLPEETPICELDELKLVDINGRTLQLSQAVMSLKKSLTGKAGTPPETAPKTKASPDAVALDLSKPRAAPELMPPREPRRASAPVSAPGNAEPPPSRPAIGPPAVEQLSLDELLRTNKAQAALDWIEKQLSAIRLAQESSDRALKAVIGLLLERGSFTADELKARMSRTARGGA